MSEFKLTLIVLKHVVGQLRTHCILLFKVVLSQFGFVRVSYHCAGLVQHNSVTAGGMRGDALTDLKTLLKVMRYSEEVIR